MKKCLGKDRKRRDSDKRAEGIYFLTKIIGNFGFFSLGAKFFFILPPKYLILVILKFLVLPIFFKVLLFVIPTFFCFTSNFIL